MGSQGFLESGLFSEEGFLTDLSLVGSFCGLLDGVIRFDPSPESQPKALQPELPEMPRRWNSHQKNQNLSPKLPEMQGCSPETLDPLEIKKTRPSVLINLKP